MKSRTIIIALLFTSTQSFAQRLITFTTQNNPDRTVSIYANSIAYGEYTARLSFSLLSGFTSRSMTTDDIALVRVNRGNSEVMKFTRENSFGNPSIQYRSQYFPGRAFRKEPDTSFEYLVPSGAGSNVKVTGVSSTVSQLSQKINSEYRGTGFAYHLGDTICAARAGTIFVVNDTAKEGEKIEAVYKSGRNRIDIQHRDGTLGIYGISAPIKLLVSPGDEVIPGQPLAVFNKESEKYRLYFSTCYLDESKLLAGNIFDVNVVYTYMPTHFYAGENERSSVLQVGKEYIVQHSRDIIISEMTKREKKKAGF